MKAKKYTNPNAWTKSEKNTLAKCLKSGMSAIETADKIGRTTSAVWCMKHKMVQNGEITYTTFRNHNVPMAVKKSKPVAIATKPVSKKKTAKRK